MNLKYILIIIWCSCNFRYDKPCTYYDAILPLRVLLLKYSNPKVYELVNLLMDHNDMLDEATVKRRQTLVDFLRKSCKLAQDFSNEEVHKVLGILSVNSFVVHDGGSDEANSDLIGKQLTNNPKNIVLCSKKQGFTQE